MNLSKLFNPKSIAVVGASPEEGKVGHVIMKNLFELGYEGQVFLVNPKYDDIYSQKCYHELSDIKEKIDLAILAIPAKFVITEIEKNAERIKNYVIISAGFSEAGPEGKEREKELAFLAERKKLNILGPNCLGFIVPRLKLNASFAGSLPEAGNISFVSQSGALAVAIMDIAAASGMKFSNIVSVGNKMRLSESEMLEYLADEKETKVIGMYLEGIKDGQKFIEIASRVSKQKPIIILKAGKNAKTQKAISSHTGALAGDDDVVSAVFKKTGVLRARDLEELFDLFELMSNYEAPKTGKVAVVTNAGGVGVLTSDAFSNKSIELANLDNRIKNKLRSFLPEEGSVENPIDLLGDAKEDRYLKTLKVLSGVDEIGAIICILTPQDQTPVEKIAEEIIKIKNRTNKFVVTVFLGGTRIEKSVARLKENGICNFSFPDRAVLAIDGYYRWNNFKKFKIKKEKLIINNKRKNKVSQIITRAKEDGRSALYFSEAREVMEMYAVPTIQSQSIFPGKEFSFSKIKFPAVLKVDSDQVLHKTDKNALILDIKNKEKLQEAIDEMRKDFPAERLIVQEMAEKGMELILGLKRDPIFGSVIVYGLGGIYTEILRQVDYLVAPLSLSQIEDSLRQGKLSFLFEGARGQRKYNIEELARILEGISFMAMEIPQIREFDINPLIVYNKDMRAVAVDVKIII